MQDQKIPGSFPEIFFGEKKEENAQLESSEKINRKDVPYCLTLIIVNYIIQ